MIENMARSNTNNATYSEMLRYWLGKLSYSRKLLKEPTSNSAKIPKSPPIGYAFGKLTP